MTVTREGTLRVRLRNPAAVLARLRRYYPVGLTEESESGDFDAMSIRVLPDLVERLIIGDKPQIAA